VKNPPAPKRVQMPLKHFPKTQILLYGDLGCLNKKSPSELLRDIGEIGRMLKALIKSLENKHLDP